jgi:hypothetical protein
MFDARKRKLMLVCTVSCQLRMHRVIKAFAVESK